MEFSVLTGVEVKLLLVSVGEATGVVMLEFEELGVDGSREFELLHLVTCLFNLVCFISFLVSAFSELFSVFNLMSKIM